MRKRDRLKNRIKRIMGGNVHGQPSGVATPSPSAPPPIQPAPLPSPRSTPSKPTPSGPALASKDSPAASADLEADERAEKAAKHVERTRVAMLKFVIDQGGQASMADMHELSERRYFIGHKRFSDLMEGIVGEGLIDFDHASGMATITDAGAAYVAE